MIIRILDAVNAAAYQALRLEGLTESPSAFASSYEEERDRALARVSEDLVPDLRRCVIGAFLGSQLIGVVGLQREEMRKLEHKALIWGMFVAPPFRRRGVGRMLIARALEVAAAMPGVRQVNLGVNAANGAALALYESMGFEPFGIERGFMLLEGRLHDEIHMVRVLEGR